MKSPPIYVELPIQCAIDDLWDRTQVPKQHARWDLRFTEIEYLPRRDSSEPQQFLYGTRIGFGLAIHGVGETIGTGEPNGIRTSALKFGSDDPKSLILEGSGYWKYVPIEGAVKFLTQYDYRTRFGAVGSLFDRVVFRPLLGWATAWSFDCLRLWLEEGQSPEVSLRRSLVHGLARVSLALIWIYQGVIPKIIRRDPAELALVEGSGLFVVPRARFFKSSES